MGRIMIKDNNSGFTLLELVISVAIMSLIILIGGQFMVTSANSYSSLHRSVSLSQESKQVMEQISENSLDSSAAVVGADINNNDGIIYFVEYTGKVQKGTQIYSNTDDTVINGNGFQKLYNIYAYKYDTNKHALEYGEINNTILTSNCEINEKDWVTLAENVSEFTVNIKHNPSESYSSGQSTMIEYANRVEINLTLEKRGKKFSSKYTTDFRGRTLYPDGFSTLTSDPYKEEVDER